MAKQQEEMTTAAKLESKFNAFLLAKKKLLIIIAVAILVIVVGLWIGLSVADSRADNLQLAIDNAQRTYDQWMVQENRDSSEAQALRESLVADLTELSGKGGKSYPILKSEYLLGLIAYTEGAYSEAMEHFASVAQKGNGTYMGSLALYNAGATSELLGDTAQALEYYQSLYDTYGSDAAESARALFSVARLHEHQGNVDLARAVLQQLADEFSASEYAKLARSRLVTLQ